MAYTIEQLQAITTLSGPLLVAAGAGAGKTAVLVERVLNLVMEKRVDIDTLLVLTFTKAAAAEMRERISAALLSRLAQEPDNEHLQRQLGLLNNAQINTIHAFCSDLLRDYYYLLDLSPKFRIAEETELRLLRSEILRRVIDRQYEREDNAAFLLFLDLYCDYKNDEKAEKILLNLFDRLMSEPEPMKKLEQWERMFDLGIGDDPLATPWGEILKTETYEDIEYAQRLLDEALAALEGAEEGLVRAYLPALQSDRDQLSQLKERVGQGGYDEIRRAFQNLSFDKLGSARGLSDSAEALFIKAARSEEKDVLLKAQKNYFAGSAADAVGDLLAVAPAIHCICALLREFSEELELAKKKRGLLDFSDLEHKAAQLLWEGEEVSPLAGELRGRYYEILVDEYQDTSAIQEKIFVALSDRNLFLVGDVKQSIYRFREARPDLFLQKYRAFGSAPGGAGQKILLSQNFRSRAGILAFLNGLFARDMSPGLGGLAYTEDEYLNFGAEYYPPAGDEAEVELHLLLGEVDEEENPQSPVEREARYVARRIEELIAAKTPVYDKKLGTTRPAQYRDIVLLMRSVSGKASTFTKALEEREIPVYSDSGAAFFERREIMVLLSLLRVIDNPNQDIPLISVLRSPIFAFDEDELLTIRLADREKSLYECLVVRAQTDGKCRAFLERLAQYRDRASYSSVDQLLWYLYEETGFYALCGAMKNGELRRANLTMLFEYARQYEETSFKGVYNFIRYIERLRETKEDLVPAKVLGENSDVVRVMSIHKSKGLEFPICFLCETAAPFNYSDLYAPVLLDGELGFGPQYRDLSLKVTRPTLAKKALIARERREALSEEMRILYVAMTRAREKLVITGRVRNLERKVGKLLGVPGPGAGEAFLPNILRKNASFLDWILLYALRHPDGAPIVRAAGLCPVNRFTGGRFAVELVRGAGSGEERPAADAGANTTAPNPVLLSEYQKRLSFRYPFKRLSQIPAKLSVTELKGKLIDEELKQGENLEKKPTKKSRIPSFLEEGTTLTPAQRGTALHVVMQYIDYGKTGSLSEVQAQIADLYQREFITAQQAEGADAEKIFTFFQSPVAQEIRAAKQVWREERFNLKMDLRELFGPDYPAEESTLIQGVIDCFFEDERGMVTLLDFKSDRITAKEREELYTRYGLQLELYEKAIERVYQKKVDRRAIYLFHSGECVFF